MAARSLPCRVPQCRPHRFIFSVHPSPLGNQFHFWYFGPENIKSKLQKSSWFPSRHRSSCDRASVFRCWWRKLLSDGCKPSNPSAVKHSTCSCWLKEYFWEYSHKSKSGTEQTEASVMLMMFWWLLSHHSLLSLSRLNAFNSQIMFSVFRNLSGFKGQNVCRQWNWFRFVLWSNSSRYSTWTKPPNKTRVDTITHSSACWNDVLLELKRSVDYLITQYLSLKSVFK